MLSPTGLEFFFWWLDILTVLVLGAVIWAAARRWIGRPKRLEGLQGYEPGIILMATGSLMLFHQLTQISIVAAAEANPATIAYLGGAITPEIAAGTPISGSIGTALGSSGFSASAAKTLHGIFYWVHFLITVGFGAYIPTSKHFHIIASPLNAFFRKLTPRGALRPIPNMEEAEVWGAKHPHEFTWKELVDGYACAVCGRCTFNCPANISGKPLSPMDLVEGVKYNLLEVAPAVSKAATQEEREQASDELPLLGRHFTEEWVVGLRDLRGVRAGVPGARRSHRQHRRPAALPGDDGVEHAAHGAADAAEPGDAGASVAGRAGVADGLDGRAAGEEPG